MADNHSQTRRTQRRARRVCMQCHERKLRCDLENRLAPERCSNCARAQITCQARASKRQKRSTHGSIDGLHSTWAVAEDASTTVLSPGLDGMGGENVFTPGAAVPIANTPSTTATHQSNSIQPAVTAASEERPLASLAQGNGLQAGNTVPHPQTAANHDSANRSYLGDSGLLPILEPESLFHAADNQPSLMQLSTSTLDLPPLELQQSFAETFFEYCWPWSPVLDKEDLYNIVGATASPLLANALALLGSHIRPPLVQHAGPAAYYNRAKMLFYTDQEVDPLTCLQAIVLFYWWAPRSPATVHKDAAWWWTGLAIKYAQQMGLHRESSVHQNAGNERTQCIRRRIWWTLFARERLTGICQGRPCTIDPADCTVREPTREDFPDADPRADVFIYWVRLCSIIGRSGKHLSQNRASHQFPATLAHSLIDWVNSLPCELFLPIGTQRTLKFDRNIHNLYLPYLTTLILLHTSRSSQSPSCIVPESCTSAVLAASCIARIFKDYLARSDLKFLGAISCWYVGVAILALLNTRGIEELAPAGADDIQILRLALDKLADIWPSAAIFVTAFRKQRVFEAHDNSIRNTDRTQGSDHYRSEIQEASITSASSLYDLNMAHGISWTSYFPFATSYTSNIANILLADQEKDLWSDITWLDDPNLQLQTLFDSSGVFPQDFM